MQHQEERHHPLAFFSASHESEEEAGRRLQRRLRALEIRTPYVVTSRHGGRLARGVEDSVAVERSSTNMDQTWAAELAGRVTASRADAVVGVGGGRCLDATKLAASVAGVPFVAVPTQLSHDGLCSPVAVVPSARSAKDSVAVAGPRAVFISVRTLMAAPLSSLRAGVGDVLSNPLALKDWELAATLGLDEIDTAGWELSVESYDLIGPLLDRDLSEASADPRIVTLLANALIVSGMSMTIAGSSRPASGAEHKISHSIDELLGGRAHHGAQVAFGCVISAALHGEDPQRWRRRLRRLGLPDHPRDLGLNEDLLVRVLLNAPQTRPRHTILEQACMNDEGIRSLVRSIWREP